jgi:hypothetical protein
LQSAQLPPVSKSLLARTGTLTNKTIDESNKEIPMKKSIILSVMALLATVTTAHAAEDQRWAERLFRFDFQCEFDRHHDGATTQTERHSEFEAVARIFANVRADHESHLMDDAFDNAVQAEGLRNLLAVARNGNLFYADGAILASGKREVVIAAANGQRLAIVIPRRDHDAPAAEWMKYRSFLILGEHKIPGNCEVRARPVEKGHEYDDENQDAAPIAAPAAPAVPMN